MNLGAFSISLNVKDIHKSKEFYEKLGFKVFQGEIDQGWLIMKNGETIIGLFAGMLDSNIYTFNPGWNQNAENIDPYDDIRKIEQSLISQGLEIIGKVENDAGPGNFMIKDPDGNTILFDQHR